MHTAILRGPRVLSFLAASALVVGACVACSSDKGGGSTAPTPSVSISASPASLTLVAGASGQVTVTLLRGGGFVGVVSLAISGLPNGVSATVTPAQLTGATTSATVELAVAATTAPGSYTATVTGASSLGSASATYSLVVTAAPDFTLAVTATSSAPVIVLRGGSATHAVSIARAGSFAGAVALAASTLPAGVTATFDPSTPTGNSSSVTLSAATSAVAGDYSVTISGSATGMPTRTVALPLRVADPPDFVLSVSPTALSIDRGSSASVALQLTRSGGFAGDVALALVSPPAGITATFAPASVSGNTATLTLSVGNGVAGGSYALVVQGTGTGVGSRSATLALTVTIPPSLTLSPADTTVNVAQFASVAVPLALARTNATGSVSFAATGAPTGVTIAFAPSQTSGATTTLSANVALTTPPGTYPITVTASIAGGPQATAIVRLAVSAAAGSVAEYRFCSNSFVPVFFAYQDGNGAWRAITPEVRDGTAAFQFPITAAHAGVAFVQRLSATQYYTYVVHLLKDELIAQGPNWCGRSLATAPVNGTVAGVDAGEWARVAIGNASMNVAGSPTQPIGFQLQDAMVGTQDLIASRQNVSGVTDRFVVMRGLTVNSVSTTLPAVDFNGPLAVGAVAGTATVANTLGDWLTSFTSYQTSRGLTGWITQWSNFSTNTSRTFYGLPASAQAAGDVMAIHVRASSAAAVQPTDVREALVALDPGATSAGVALGSRGTPATVTAISSAPLRLRAQGTLPADLRSLLMIDVASTGGGNVATLVASNGYLALVGSSGTYDLSIPDLSSLTGYPAAAALVSGSFVVTTSAASVSGGLDIDPFQPFRAGLVILWGRTYRAATF